MKTKKKTKQPVVKISKTTQETIPYINVFKNGIIEIAPGYYTKTYLLSDVDIKTVSEETEETILDTFMNLINTADESMAVQFTINNIPINKEDFEKKILSRLKGDALDELRIENNEILRDKLREGRSNMRHMRYMTLSTEAESIDEALIRFSSLDGQINSILKKITQESTESLSLGERLEVLYDIFNRGKNDFDGKNFDYKEVCKHGLTSKDIIAPMDMSFKTNYIRLEDKYARVLMLSKRSLPSKLSTDMLGDVINLPLDMLISVNLQPVNPERAIKLAQRQLTKAKKDVSNAQTTATKNGYSPELIPEPTKKAYNNADIMLGQLEEEDQKMFLTNVLILLYANTKEELEKNTKTISLAVSKHLCSFTVMTGLQEIGFKDVLPLCNIQLPVNSLFTTEDVSLFCPYTTKEILDQGGNYYGLHSVSRNLIIYNRKAAVNGNGIILGMPGTGKSFSAKREMEQVILNSNDMVYVIDPQGEYSPLIKLLGGSEIEIQIGSDKYLNPMDMDIEYAGDEDPITLKSDYICSIIEIALKSPYGLSPVQKTVINRCVRLVYKDYMKYIMEVRKNGQNITIDRSKMPTLQDLYELLLTQDEPEARYIATTLELYMDGNGFDVFSHQTNIQTEGRVVSYNIKGIGENMRELGLNVCLNTLWNQIIQNHKKGIRTWLYLDEFHLLAKNDSSAEFVKKIYKMARKWGCIPTGITQNVSDLLLNEKAKAIIRNCTFVYMLSQSPADRDELAEIYDISDNQLQYITNGGYGEGLIYNGKELIPFKDEFPNDTKLYKAMTTKPEDFIANLA